MMCPAFKKVTALDESVATFTSASTDSRDMKAWLIRTLTARHIELKFAIDAYRTDPEANGNRLQTAVEDVDTVLCALLREFP